MIKNAKVFIAALMCSIMSLNCSAPDCNKFPAVEDVQISPDSEWVGNQAPNDKQFSFDCTARVAVTNGAGKFFEGFIKQSGIDITTKALYQGMFAKTFGAWRALAMDLAKIFFKNGFLSSRDNIDLFLIKNGWNTSPADKITVDNVHCEETFANKPPLTCSMEGFNGGNDLPAPGDPGTVDPGPVPGSGAQPGGNGK
jgi:hypothetical protein